ncbi:hypothetical protein M8J76_000958 [Diaphorina citri]|nr:hypothetical protein M8J76_000958 [Diaphorina citri]
MPVEDLTVSFDNGICDKPKNMIDVRACYKPTEKIPVNINYLLVHFLLVTARQSRLVSFAISWQEICNLNVSK